jgi:RNase adapter protein RapZ
LKKKPFLPFNRAKSPSGRRNSSSLSAGIDCVVVSGLSGAGKTLALRALEDLGYFCVDNFPLHLLSPLIAYYRDMGQHLTKIAIGVDVRTGTLGLRQSLLKLQKQGVHSRVLFLDCDDDTLLRRFSETRRRHPLSGSVLSGIRKERRSLDEVKTIADKIIDTSRLTPTEMKEVVVRTLGLQHPRGMAVVLTSFGYKHGIPLDADLVWDVRFLPNPNYVRHLHSLTGRHKAVSSYVLRNPVARKFMDSLTQMLEFLLDQFSQEGKSYLTVAIGCTGGRHRSVAIAEALADYVRKRKRFDVRVMHRDADRHV